MQRLDLAFGSVEVCSAFQGKAPDTPDRRTAAGYMATPANVPAFAPQRARRTIGAPPTSWPALPVLRPVRSAARRDSRAVTLGSERRIVSSSMLVCE